VGLAVCRLHKIYIDEVMQGKAKSGEGPGGSEGGGGGARRTWRAFEMDATGRIIEIMREDNASAQQRQKDTQISRLEALKKRNNLG
jgi:hypothetical protein